jgi:chaperone modulatory protein CbpM
MGEEVMSGTVMRITVSELCEQEGVSRSMLAQLVKHEIAQPLAGVSVDDWVFDVTSAQWMNRAIRLQRDLDIEWIAVAMLIDLLRERDALARENQCLRQRLERFLQAD